MDDDKRLMAKSVNDGYYDYNYYYWETNPVASIAYYSTTPTHSFSLNLSVYRKDTLKNSYGVCVFPPLSTKQSLNREGVSQDMTVEEEDWPFSAYKSYSRWKQYYFLWTTLCKPWHGTMKMCYIIYWYGLCGCTRVYLKLNDSYDLMSVWLSSVVSDWIVQMRVNGWRMNE